MKRKLVIELGKVNPNIYTHISYLETEQAIKNKENIIKTPVTSFFTTTLLNDYLVFATNGNTREIICLNDLVNSGEIRMSQNAEYMLLSGCFGLINDRCQNNLDDKRKLKQELSNKCKCNFQINETEYLFEILYDNKEYGESSNFFNEVIDICEEYLNEKQMDKLVICYDYLNEIKKDNNSIIKTNKLGLPVISGKGKTMREMFNEDYR